MDKDLGLFISELPPLSQEMLDLLGARRMTARDYGIGRGELVLPRYPHVTHLPMFTSLEEVLEQVKPDPLLDMAMLQELIAAARNPRKSLSLKATAEALFKDAPTKRARSDTAPKQKKGRSKYTRKRGK